MGNPIAQQCPPTRKPTDHVKVNLYAVGLLCCVCCSFVLFGQVGDSRLGWGRSSDLEDSGRSSGREMGTRILSGRSWFTPLSSRLAG